MASALLIGGVFYFYGQPKGLPSPSAMMPGGPPPAPPVSVAEVMEREVQLWHEFSGRLVAIDHVDIRPRVSGTIEFIYFKNGATVKKDDLLFTIDPKPFEAALQSAKAKAAFAESEWKRAEMLQTNKAIATREYEQRKNEAETARANLAIAQLNYDYTQIKSPIDGKVSRAEITVGNLVEAGPTAPILTSVVAYSPIYVDFDVDEATYLRYAKNSAQSESELPITLQVGEEITRTGRIESFDNRVNPSSGTIRARAIFDNEDGALVPGVFARVQLGSAEKAKAVLITDRAIGTDQSKKFVLVVTEENKAEYREITIGQNVEGLRVVESGLKSGEKIIVNGLQRARPGSPVTPETVEMK